MAGGVLDAVGCAAKAGALLGEGPLWDSDRGCLWWVDILGGVLHRHDLASGLGAASPQARALSALGLRRAGGLITCGEAGFAHYDPERDLLTPLPSSSPEPAGVRFNDGKVDAAGRFWAGTMQDEPVDPVGELRRLDGAGRVTRVRGGFLVPNGPAFDSLGRIYFADSPTGVIHRATVDAEGALQDLEPFVKFAPDWGVPDGMTVDAQDHLWVACWDGWSVRRFTPEGGLARRVALPVQRPTSCAFAGPDLDRLFVTSARVGLTDAERVAQPDAGGLFEVDPGVAGVAPALFG